MTQRQTGWLILLAAFGMWVGLIGAELSMLHEWSEATAVPFVGKALLHLATVIGAAIGGKFLPQPPIREY